jgi:AcrR family transcriptional regulator
MSEALANGFAGVGRRQRTPRSSAQLRLLDALTQAAGGEGYSDLTVERVLEVAGVSRASFYQYFSSLDDCFADAYRRQAEKLTHDIARAIRAGESAEFALLAALVGMGRCDPDGARLLAIEGLAAGPIGRRVRDELVASVERVMSVVGTGGQCADLPSWVLIGAALRFIAMRLTDSGITEPALAESWVWIAAFRGPDTQFGWSARFAPTLPVHASVRPQLPTAGPLRGSARERLLHAAAVTVKEKGYRGVVVADIVAAAGVSRRSFYNEFVNKSDVVSAASEHAFVRVVESCAPAFFSAKGWPERVWQSALAFTELFTNEPWLAHLGFVECYAVGRWFVQRAHDMQGAFTLFLEEGYRQRGGGRRELPRLCSEMTTAAIMEIGFQASRGPLGPPIRCLQPLAVYIVLTPFIGAENAAEFILGVLHSTDVGGRSKDVPLATAHDVCQGGARPTGD